MNNIKKIIEDKYNELLKNINPDMLFSVLQSSYGKIVTNKYRDSILHYIAASILMDETGKLQCNVSKDGMHISVEGVDEIYNEAIKYLNGLDSEMKRITINNTSSFPNIASMIIGISGNTGLENNLEDYGIDDEGNYIDKIDLDAEELSQNIKDRIEKGGGKGSVERKIKKILESYPYHWEFYELLYEVTNDFEIIEEGFDKLKNKIFRECDGNWPKTIQWGFTNNRPLLGFIKTYGLGLWLFGRNEKAIEILNLLLQLNDNDNQGNRYDLLAIKEGLSYKEFMEKFDKGGYFDSDISDWFDKNSKKYSKFKKYFD